MKSTCRIRLANQGDLETLVQFNIAMADESEGKGLDPERLRKGVIGLLQSDRDGFYLIAEREGKPVGSLMVTYEWSDWRNGRFWWIQSVYVLPSCRRQGVYSELHERVRQLALEDGGACGIRLYVEHENHGAMATYEALGMIRTHYRLYEEEF